VLQGDTDALTRQAVIHIMTFRVESRNMRGRSDHEGKRVAMARRRRNSKIDRELTGRARRP